MILIIIMEMYMDHPTQRAEISLTLHKCCLRMRYPEIMDETLACMLVLVPLKNDMGEPYHALLEVTLAPLRSLLLQDGATTVDVGPFTRLLYMGKGYEPDAVSDGILVEYAVPLLPLALA